MLRLQGIDRVLQLGRRFVHIRLARFRVADQLLCLRFQEDDPLCARFGIGVQIEAVHLPDQRFQCADVRLCARHQPGFAQARCRFIER